SQRGWTSGSTSSATSSPGSATPETACTAWSDPSGAERVGAAGHDGHEQRQHQQEQQADGDPRVALLLGVVLLGPGGLVDGPVQLLAPVLVHEQSPPGRFSPHNDYPWRAV